MTKTCNKCHQDKAFTEYQHQKSTKDGYKLYCKSCIKQIMALRYELNKDKLKLQVKIWSAKNRDKMKQYKTRWDKTPIGKLRKNLRRRLQEAVKLCQNTHKFSFTRSIGCKYIQLKQHIESQFQPGMTWNNYGDWHIDHIRPVSSFDLTNVDDCQKVNHYTNLQPLWAQDNIKKGDSYDKP